MRAAPPLEFTVRRFGAWRAALALLAVLGAALMAQWWHGADRPRPPAMALVALAGALLAALPLAQSRRLHACKLRWDGQRWHLAVAQASARSHGGEPAAGQLAVAIDLGGWLLLRFAAEAVAATRLRVPHAAWIPLQRRGLEGEWHAIRGTLYSPRPAPAAARPAE